MTEQPEYFSPGNTSDNFMGDDTPKVDYSALFDAPDFSTLIKHSPSPQAKEYTAKVNSLLKAAVTTQLRSGNIPDAAAILQHGPQFSQAVGDLTDTSDFAKRAVDILTAPESPLFIFALTAGALGFQIYRNHEKEIATASLTMRERRAMRKQAKASGEKVVREPAKTVTVKLPFGRKITLNVRFKMPVISSVAKIFKSQTAEPSILVNTVFSDPKLQRALKAQGFIIGTKNDD